MTGQQKKHKTSKVKSFLFFLLLALVFWVLTKFSEETTAVINANLAFINVPESVSISSSTPSDIDFNISANGFAFLSYNINAPKIDIDISKYYKEGDSLISISSSELDKIIMAHFGNDTRVSNRSLSTLKIPLDILVSKKVPIQLISEITYKEGYKVVGKPILTPDSVTISGPSALVQDMDSVISEVYTNKNVSETLENSIDLHLDENSKMSLSAEKIDFKIIVEEFAQKRLTLPVTVINVPLDIKLKLLPESIVMSFDVSVNQFNSISENDFKIVCDYALRSSGENILVPKLVTQPEGLYHIEWSTRKVEYLIFK
jgi:hypothetical protein